MCPTRPMTAEGKQEYVAYVSGADISEYIKKELSNKVYRINYTIYKRIGSFI